MRAICLLMFLIFSAVPASAQNSVEEDLQRLRDAVTAMQLDLEEAKRDRNLAIGSLVVFGGATVCSLVVFFRNFRVFRSRWSDFGLSTKSMQQGHHRRTLTPYPSTPRDGSV